MECIRNEGKDPQTAACNKDSIWSNQSGNYNRVNYIFLMFSFDKNVSVFGNVRKIQLTGS